MSPPPSSGTFYVNTAYEGTHLRRKKPLDPRFDTKQSATVFYVVDKVCQLDWPVAGRCVIEYERSPALWALGKDHMAEWSFLLNEYEQPFARYPFYFISSRFYEKNSHLTGSLDGLSDYLFGGLERYGWGYLPSYDRPPGYEDLLGYSCGGHLGITEGGLALVRSLYGVDMLRDVRWFSDFFCNYIGFHSREHLVRYVDFYRPLLDFFFDAQWRLKRDISPYVRRLGVYHNEKPLTFLFEMVSHLFFYQNKLPFFGFHPEGFFEIREHEAGIAPIGDLPASPACCEEWSRHLLRYGRYDRARTTLLGVIAAAPERNGAYLALAKAMIGRGEVPEARDVLMSGLPHHPDFAALIKDLDRLIGNSAPPGVQR